MLMEEIWPFGKAKTRLESPTEHVPAHFREADLLMFYCHHGWTCGFEKQGSGPRL